MVLESLHHFFAELLLFPFVEELERALAQDFVFLLAAGAAARLGLRQGFGHAALICKICLGELRMTAPPPAVLWADTWRQGRILHLLIACCMFFLRPFGNLRAGLCNLGRFGRAPQRLLPQIFLTAVP